MDESKRLSTNFLAQVGGSNNLQMHYFASTGIESSIHLVEGP